MPSGEYTFRGWNPKKEMVPYGESTEPDVESGCCSCSCCCCAELMDKFFDSLFPLILNDVEPNIISKEAIFKRDRTEKKHIVNIIRLLAWLTLFIGIGLLFSPIIELVSFIPLIGTFIAAGIAIAVWIVAFILSIVIFGITISLAWLFYRPIIAIGVIALITGIVLACVYG